MYHDFPQVRTIISWFSFIPAIDIPTIYLPYTYHIPTIHLPYTPYTYHIPTIAIGVAPSNPQPFFCLRKKAEDFEAARLTGAVQAGEQRSRRCQQCHWATTKTGNGVTGPPEATGNLEVMR